MVDPWAAVRRESYFSLTSRRWVGVQTLYDGPDLKKHSLDGLGRKFCACFSARQDSSGGFFCSSIPVVLFDNPGL